MPNRERRRAGSAVLEGRARAGAVCHRIGTGLLEARTALGLTQDAVAVRAGIAQASWSRIERGIATTVSIETLAACAAAVEVQLAAFIEARPGSDLPRDVEHLGRQELVIEMARRGGWLARPEVGIDPGANRSRSIDVHLQRRMGAEQVVVEIEDFLSDGGAVFRNLADKTSAIRRASRPDSRVQGLLVLRATTRNRATVAAYPSLFGSRFSGSSTSWIRALTDPSAAMPDGDGMVWSSVRGDRLVPVRGLGGAQDRRR